MDYDDTVFDFHGKGYSYPDVIAILKECSDLGFTIILFTTVVPSDTLNGELGEKVKKLEVEYGIKVGFVNDGPVMSGAKKPYYNLLLDDKAGLYQAYVILKKTLGLIKNETV